MNRYNRCASIGVSQEMMAPLGPHSHETSSRKHCDQLLARHAGQLAHAATTTRCTPTNSSLVGGSPSTSRHNSMASFARLMSSSSDGACVWHPGRLGTDAT